LLRFTPRTKTYDQGLKKNEKNEIEVHHQFLETKILATKHKQHFEFQYESLVEKLLFTTNRLQLKLSFATIVVANDYHL
jgi:hypothetical protein